MGLALLTKPVAAPENSDSWVGSRIVSVIAFWWTILSSGVTMPSGRFPPSGVGISTRRTGGTLYAHFHSARIRAGQSSGISTLPRTFPMPSTPAAISLLRKKNASVSSGTVMWWKSATRRSSEFLFVACRIRSAACDTLSRFDVRLVFYPLDFPSAAALGSTLSAGCCRPSFAGFSAMMVEFNYFNLNSAVGV